MADKFKVTATSLNLRSRPIERPGNRIALLPNGHEVTKISEAADERWWEVTTTLQQHDLQGFVAHRFLTPVSNFVEPPHHNRVTEIHLPTNGRTISRSQTSGRAHPLTEAGRPFRIGTTPSDRASQLTEIIDWLDVENSARYRREPGKTFCNIYAYDYCNLSKVFLPRVWWSPRAIARLEAGDSVTPQLGVTLNELNANSLFNWFNEFGSTFGWVRTFDLTDLQDAANNGSVCIISGQRVDLNTPGHICPVVPEISGQSAMRSGGRVTKPLQSQSGARNRKYFNDDAWWTRSMFRAFSFWKHE